MKPQPQEHPETLLAKGSQLNQVSTVLTRAFQHDPAARYVFPDETGYRERAQAFFAAAATYVNLAGQVWTTADPVQGAALWLPPEHRDMHPEHAVTAGLHDFGVLVGEDAGERLGKLLGFLDECHHCAVPQPHWYLMLLGVDTPLQGQGIGSAVLQPILKRADQEGTPCYLETCQPRNVPLYRKHGFEVVGEGTIPESEVRYWCFARPPMT